MNIFFKVNTRGTQDSVITELYCRRKLQYIKTLARTKKQLSVSSLVVGMEASSMVKSTEANTENLVQN